MPKARARKASSSDSDSGPNDRGPVKKTKVAVSTSAKKDTDEETFEIGKNRSIRLTEFKGKFYVDIREFYMADGEMKPGRKGIMLTMEQWQKFKDIMPEIEEAIKRKV